MSCPKWALAPLLILASTAVAVLGRMAFDWTVGPAPAFLIPFFLPVVLTALYSGTRWGLFATALNAAIVAYFFTPPEFSFGIPDFEDRVRLGTFVVVGGVFSGLAGSLCHHRRRAEEHVRLLEREVAGRREVERLLELRVAERTAEAVAQNRLLDAVLDALPVAAIIADPTGKFIRVNRATCDMFGAVPPTNGVEDYPAWFGYWPGTGRRVEPMEWPLSRAIFGGESCTDQIVIERFGDHARRTLQVSATAVRGPDGAIIAGVVTAVDLTDREVAERALKESERRFRAFMTHAPFAAWIVNADSRGVYTSPGFDPHLGLAPGSYIGRRPADLWPAEIAGAYVENDRRVLAGGVAVKTDEPFVRHDGSPGVAHVVKFPMTGPQGEPLIGGVAIDITDGKRNEEALRLSEERFRLAVEATGMGVWDTPVPFAALGWDDRMKLIWGLPPDAVVDTAAMSRLIHPDDRADAERVHAEAIDPSGSGVLKAEFRICRPDGVRWVSAWGKTVFGNSHAGRTPARSVGVVLDVTDRVAAERQLAESEERFRSAFEFAPIGLALVAPDGKWLRVNGSVCEMIGYSEAELLATDFQTITHPDDLDADREFVRQMLAGTLPAYQMEKRYVHKRGHVVHVLLSVSLVRDGSGSPLHFISQIMDITRRKEDERALAANDALLRQFIEHSPAAIAMFDREVRYIQASNRWLSDYGLAGQNVIGLSHYDLFPNLPGRWKEVHRRVLDGAVEACEEDTFHSADGSTEWLQWECRPWHDADGEVGGLIMFGLLITERKRAEAALRLSEERFRRLVEGVADHAILMLDVGGTILSWNPAAVRIKGYTTEEIVGRHFSVFYTPEAVTAGHPKHELAVAVAEGRYHEEGERVRKDGSRFWAAVTLSTLRDQAGRHVGFVKFTHDISQRKRAEELVRASLKEKEVLLKEIHHRVKNNLQIVSALLHLQSANLPDRAVREMFEETRGRVKSMALIHERLYRSGDLAGVDLSEYVRQLADDVYRAYRVSQESVRLDLAVSVPPLPLDVAIPCGLLLNEMISNCLKHAFKGRAAGRIGVTFRRTPDGNVVLSVSDDGTGFPPGLDFRTTTSFGLQLIHTLADQLHGHADLTTGDGATVAVTFPAPKEASR